MEIDDCIENGLNPFIDHMMLNREKAYFIEKEEEDFLEENKNPSEILEIKNETE